MTLAALLSHFNIAHPRFVTVAGQVVFDGVSSTATGHAHATFGAVTPVAPHKFHGGEDVPDALTGDEVVRWSTGEEINRHNDAMIQSFPFFTYMPAEDHRGPCWVGDIDTGRGVFRIGVFLRWDGGLPGVAVLDRKRLGAQRGRVWVRSPHLYDSGNICVARQDDYEPGTHTAATVTAWSAHWLAAYTEWIFTQKWPIEGVTKSAT